MHLGFWWEDSIRVDLAVLTMGWYGLDACATVEGPVAGSCEHGDEPFGCIECLKILKWPSDWWLLQDSVPWSF
jgi:hypothetical protein